MHVIQSVVEHTMHYVCILSRIDSGMVSGVWYLVKGPYGVPKGILEGQGSGVLGEGVR